MANNDLPIVYINIYFFVIHIFRYCFRLKMQIVKYNIGNYIIILLNYLIQ